jgi:hypothetical protein
LGESQNNQPIADRPTNAARGPMGLTLQAAKGGNLQDGSIFSSMKYDIDFTHQRDESHAGIG